MISPRFTLIQWLVLSLPIAVITIFLLTAASWQIHQWGLSWLWGVITIALVGWRWLLVKWTKPIQESLSVLEKLETIRFYENRDINTDQKLLELETDFQIILKNSEKDQPLWQDFPSFSQRCQEVIQTVAYCYHPEVKYPLLNIYIPQAYGLIRGTVDDLDRWLNQLSPALNQITLAQAYQSYEVYQKLEPSLRKAWQLWNWAQWFLNPAAAIANQFSQGSNEQATQALLGNFSQLLREAALRNLCRQAISLYSGQALPSGYFTTQNSGLTKASTQTLQELLLTAESPTKLEIKPVNLLIVGRTGAGKSSLINSLFQADFIQTDLLPNTQDLQQYQWQTESGESLIMWDSPGYEQNQRSDLREQVLNYSQTADLLLLLNPALDPSLEMDGDFLRDIQGRSPDLPTLILVTQVDKLRPIREWQPPYDWQWGEKPKEKAIREAVLYRSEQLGEYAQQVLPIVNGDNRQNRLDWGLDILGLTLFQAITPAKQIRLARFLQNIEARTLAAAKIIDHYSFQMTTTQGLTAFLKSPILQFISRLTTGSPTLAYLLAEKIPVEQLPMVIGKLQMAYDLCELLKGDVNKNLSLDLLTFWPLLLDNTGTSDRNASAFGQALIAYWTQNLNPTGIEKKFQDYLQTALL